ncbi:hypothetical protein J3E69DRAFT_310042 [Trichoderma sp. SZMC 28015]
MYLAGHCVVPSRGRIKQSWRSPTVWLRAMLRRGTLEVPLFYLHLHLHSHPLAISNGPAQQQKQQSSGGQSMLYVFLSICGQSAAALHCPSNLICKGLFGSTRCLPRLASHQRPELLLVHCSAHYPLQLSAKRPVTAPTAARAPQHSPAHRLRLRLRRPSKSQLPPSSIHSILSLRFFPSSLHSLSLTTFAPTRASLRSALFLSSIAAFRLDSSTRPAAAPSICNNFFVFFFFSFSLRPAFVATHPLPRHRHIEFGALPVGCSSKFSSAG